MVRQRNEACPSGFEYHEFRREYPEEPGASYLARGLNSSGFAGQITFEK
jgi:hypothetical protein